MRQLRIEVNAVALIQNQILPIQAHQQTSGEHEVKLLSGMRVECNRLLFGFRMNSNQERIRLATSEPGS